MLMKWLFAPLLLAILLVAPPSAAHDWYPPECCSGAFALSRYQDAVYCALLDCWGDGGQL